MLLEHAEIMVKEGAEDAFATAMQIRLQCPLDIHRSA